VKLKTIEIVNASAMLSNANYQQLPEGERIKFWKITRKLRPIAENYLKEKQSAEEEFKPSKEVMARFQKGANYELAKGMNSEPLITDEEYREIKEEYEKYRNLVNKALEDTTNKEEEIEIETLSEAGFDELIGLNKWSIPQLDTIDFIVE
jgi:hypothetical protein